jgi:hypothetical protein
MPSPYFLRWELLFQSRSLETDIIVRLPIACLREFGNDAGSLAAKKEVVTPSPV